MRRLSKTLKNCNVFLTFCAVFEKKRKMHKKQNKQTNMVFVIHIYT